MDRDSICECAGCMIQIRHRSASGRLDEVWEYDSARRCLDVVLRLGSAAPLAFNIPVCAIDKPRLGAYAMTRLDGESWRVLPTRFISYGERLVHHESTIHSAFDKRTQLVLTNAPYDVDAELEALSL